MEQPAYLSGRLLRIDRPANRLALEMHSEDRTGSGDLHRQSALAADCVKAIAKAIAARRELLSRVWCVHGRHRSHARRHGQDVVIEGAGMRPSICATRIKARHDFPTATECAETHATANVLP